MGGTTAEVFKHKEVIRKIDLRLPRVAHLAELLARDGFLNANIVNELLDWVDKY